MLVTFQVFSFQTLFRHVGPVANFVRRKKRKLLVGRVTGNRKHERAHADQETPQTDNLGLVGVGAEVGDRQDEEAGGNIVTGCDQSRLRTGQLEPGRFEK